MPAIIERLDLYGDHRHEVGASNPSVATANNPPTTLDASSTEVILLTGTPAGAIDLMTVADLTRAQNAWVLNNTGGDVNFAITGTPTGDHVAFYTALTLPDATAVNFVYEPNTVAWYTAGAPSSGGGAGARYKATGVSLVANTAYDILASTHQVGSDQHLQVIVLQDDTPGAGENKVIHVDVVIDDNGDVHLTATSSITAHVTIL